MREPTKHEIELYLNGKLSKEQKVRMEQWLVSNKANQEKVKKIKKQLKKDEAKRKMFPHSKAKVDTYNRYLQIYLSILTRVPFIKKVNILDVFCGRGFYENNEEGSPIKAVKTAIEVHKL